MTRLTTWISVFAITVMVLFQSCSSKSTPPQKAATPAKSSTETSAKKPEQFPAGQLIYETKCIACHAPKNPAMFTAEEMKNIIPNMVIKANMKAGSVIISPEDEKALMDYVLSVCKK